MDVLVIGTGPAGLAAGEAALAAGAGSVLLVDCAEPGFAGWTATLAVTAIRDAVHAGLDWGQVRSRLQAARREVNSRHQAAIEDLRRRAGRRIVLVAGRASLRGPGRVTVEPSGVAAVAGTIELQAVRVVVATGSVPCLPDVTGLADTSFIAAPDLERLLDLDRPASSVAVLGGGSTGCSLAQSLARLGVNATLVEARSAILPREDPDAAALIESALRRDGVRVLTGAPVVKVAPTLDGGAWIGTESGADVAAERLLLAAGWRPATAGLQLQLAGATVSRSGAVIVDDRLGAGSDLLAAGSVTGSAPQRDASAAMGRVAGANAARRRAREHWRGTGVPAVTRTDPELARVGLRGLEAVSVPGAVVGEVRLAGLDRAAASGRGEGLARVVISAASGGPLRPREPQRLLGATVVAPGAGDLIGGLAMAVRAGLALPTVLDTIGADCSWMSAARDAIRVALGAGEVTAVAGRAVPG